MASFPASSPSFSSSPPSSLPLLRNSNRRQNLSRSIFLLCATVAAVVVYASFEGGRSVLGNRASVQQTSRVQFRPRILSGLTRASNVYHRYPTSVCAEEERKRRSYGDTELSPEAQAELDAWKRRNEGEEDEGFTLQNLDISKIDAVTVNTILFAIIGFNFFILPFVDFTGLLSAIVGKDY